MTVVERDRETARRGGEKEPFKGADAKERFKGLNVKKILLCVPAELLQIN